MDLKSVKTLVVESDTSRCKRVAAMLEESAEMPTTCVVAHSLSTAKSAIRKQSIDIVVSGLELSDARGLDALVALNPQRERIPVIALAEGNEPDIVLDAARSLSDDCLFWEDLKGEELVQSVAFALERQELLRELQDSKTEESPNALESSYRSIVDAIDEAVFVVSRDSGALLYANATAQRWFGGKIGEVLEDALEYDLLEVDEVEMEISIRNAPLPRAALRSLSVNWGDEEEACMISMRDISKQKRAEEAFLASQRRLNYSIRGAGFWSWNLTLNRISFARSFRGVLGFDPGAFPNSVSALENALHPEDRDRVLEAFREWRKSPQEEFEVKFRIQCFDGLYVHVLSRGGRVAREGSQEIVFAGSLVRTSEVREEYESQSIEKSELESIDEEVSCVETETSAAPACALIVDDEEVLRKALDSIVRSHGLETIVAGDGAEGIELYEANRADLKLVILDVNMPRVDGIKVFERIRGSGDAVPIIMTSGNDDKHALPFTEGERDNCAFLLKPFGLADVKKIVKGMIDKPVAAG